MEGIGAGKISEEISKPNGGAGYGSCGTQGENEGGEGGIEYGDIKEPLYTGSGGGSRTTTGGKGGGLIYINATKISMNEEKLNCIYSIEWYLVLDSSGGKAIDTLSGGGSGGTIFLLFGSISGVLSLNINGGNVLIYLFFIYNNE